MLVTRTYLEMRSPEASRATPDAGAGACVEPVRPCPVALYRQLYDVVGRAHRWRDRLAWTDEQLAEHLGRADVAVWVLSDAEGAAGYFELVRHDDGAVEIAYFGLVPRAIGRGLGKHLLTRAVEEAWAWGATRVWLHTCTLDHPAALPNYVARGFTPYRTETYEVDD